MNWIKDYFNNKYEKIKSDINSNNGKDLLIKLLKLKKLQRCESKSLVLSETKLDGYKKIECKLKSEDYYSIPLTILEPLNNSNSVPVIALHGHGGGGRKSVIGDRLNPDISKAIDNFNYDYGLQLVKLGYTVFCPDNRGFGDSFDKSFNKDLLSCNCREISNLALSLDLTLMGMMVFDVQVLVDFIEKDYSLSLKNLSILGFSGGGALALYSAIIDERIKNAIISGYMYGFKESHLELFGNCSCNYIPNLWANFTMGDLGKLIYPRNLFIESGDSDHLNGSSGINNVIQEVKKIKDLYGDSKSFNHKIYNGPHKFYGDHCFYWLSQLIH